MNVEELINRLKKEDPEKNVLMFIKDSNGKVITSTIVEVKTADVFLEDTGKPPKELVVLYDRLTP